jgi:hypothetical protein
VPMRIQVRMPSSLLMQDVLGLVEHNQSKCESVASANR